MSLEQGDLREPYHELRAAAYHLPDNATKVATLEEAVRLADLLNDEGASFEARNQLARAAIFAGQERVALVAFAWVLGYVDTHPDVLDSHTLLWNYKLVVGHMTDFSTISREQIVQALDDLERRTLAAGGTAHSARELRWLFALEMGDRTRAVELFKHFQSTPRDENSDCEACIADIICWSHLENGRDEQALEVAKPILEGRLTCATVPRRTYSRLLGPLRRLGQIDRAADYQRKAYRTLKRTPALIGEVSDHVDFLALTGKLAVALRKVLHHFPYLPQKAHQLDRLDFSSSAWLLFERFTRRGDKSVRGSALDFPGCQDGTIHVTTARDWFWHDAEQLAQEFDDRNGNDDCKNNLQEIRQLAEQD